MRWVVDTPHLRLTHAADGGAVVQELRCAHCGATLGPRDVHHAPTTGADA